MHFSKLSFDEYMGRVAALIGNSMKYSKVLDATSRFGYDKKRLKEGESLYKEVLLVSQAQQKAISEKLKVHNNRKQIHLLVRKNYMKILQIARIVFNKNIIVNKALQLNGPRMTNLDEWMNQVAMFGNRLLREKKWLDELGKFGISKEDIQNLLFELDNLRSLSTLCEQSKLECKQYTSSKRSKLKVLQGWVSDYIKIAKIALDENPELLQQLNV